MDYAGCQVVYLDSSILADCSISGVDQDFDSLSNEPEIQRNIRTLVETFEQGKPFYAAIRKDKRQDVDWRILTHGLPVYLCTSGVTCLDKVKDFESIATSCTPTFIFVEVALDFGNDRLSLSETDSSDGSRPAAGTDQEKPRQDSGSTGDFSGLALIKHLTADIRRHNLSKLAIPIASVPTKRVLAVKQQLPRTEGTPSIPVLTRTSDECGQSESEHMMRCVQAGAVDVVIGELSAARAAALSVHAHRARLEAIKEQPTFLEQRRMRKRSWVGLDEERPYAYLRESM
jgi:3',5'-cyclic-nucleotide phosphodiesterase